ncbi:MAG: AAA family ATPase [Pseudomonadota bacterium]
MSGLLRALLLALALVWPVAVAAQDGGTKAEPVEGTEPYQFDREDFLRTGTADVPWTFELAGITLAAFPSALMVETQVRSAEFSIDVVVRHQGGPISSAELNAIAQRIVANLRVRTIVTGGANAPLAAGPGSGDTFYVLPDGTDIGGISNSGINASIEETETRLTISGNADVSGAVLNRFERTTFDLFFPVTIPVQLMYYTPSAPVQASNWQSVSFFPRIGFVYIVALFLGVMASISLLVVTILRRQNAVAEDEYVKGLEYKLEQAERKVRISADVAEETIATADGPPPMPLPEIPPALLRAMGEGRAMVGFGAGASAEAGLPTSRELIFELYDRLGDGLSARLRENIRQYLNNEARGRDAQWFSAVLEEIGEQSGPSRLAAEMQHLFERPVPRDTSLYNKLAHIPWRGALSLVWDDLGLEAFRNETPDLIQIRPDDHEALRRSLSDDTAVYIRGWGTLDQPEEMILSFDDLRRRLETRPEFKEQLVFLLQDRVFLFVGASPSSLREWLFTLDPYLDIREGQHFALVPVSSENVLFERQLRQYGVQLIEYDPADDHAQVGAFIDALAKAAPERVRRPPEAISLTRWEPVTKLVLHNIGPFEDLTVDLAQGYADTRDSPGFPWSVITGENGQGKSIILRALAVGLSAHDERIRRQAGNLLRFGRRRGKISVTVGEKTYHVDMIRDDGSVDGVRVTSRQRTPLAVGTALTLGFPALRGAPSDDPRGTTDMVVRPAGARDVYPLALDLVDDRLLDFKQWVVNTFRDAKEGDHSKQRVLDILDDIMQQILPGGAIGVHVPKDSHALRVRIQNPRDPEGPEILVPFDQMSQGMSSVFNWVGVFLQRVHETFREVSDLAQVPATVIVDEIDVHLHPAWQRRVVELVKTTFPKVQIIASTHSALIVSSVFREEVRVFKQVGPSHYELHPPARETFGRDATELIQGETLGVDHARSIAFDALVKEYNRLDAMPERSAKYQADLDALHVQLREAGWDGILDEPARQLTSDDVDRLTKKFGI